MDKKIFELGAHNPSVASVISRLDRHQGKIKHITAIIEWDNETSDVTHDQRDTAGLCYDSALLSGYVNNLIYDKGVIKGYALP